MWLAPWQTTVSLREGLPQHCLICTASFFEIGRVVRAPRKSAMLDPPPLAQYARSGRLFYLISPLLLPSTCIPLCAG